MIILLDNVTIQFNFAGFFDLFRITKCGKVILLQTVTECHYKLRQVLQSVTVITKWDITILVKNNMVISDNWKIANIFIE